nr:hypothetical protein [Tanacetum cinerariifolium]
MSSDNAQFAVTYTSISFDSDGSSWGIPLINANPMKLDKHVPVYVLEPEQSEYHAPSDEDIQVKDDNEDPEEDPKENPSKEHEPKDDNKDPEEDPNEEHQPEDSDETEPFEKDETAVTPPPPRHHGARISVRPQTPVTASTHEDMPPRRRFVLTAPVPGCDVAESSAATARAPRSQYNFVDTVEAGHGLVRSLVIMPGILLGLLTEQRTDRKDIRLEIDVVRGQRTVYETELQEVHQAYLSSKAQNRALLARLETLETHMSRIEWQRQSAEDLAVTQMMRIHTLETRARTNTVEDADSSWTLKKKMTDKYYPKGEIKKLEIELWNLRVKGNDVAAYTQRFQELALMCTKFLADETEKVDKYISGLPDNIHGNVMSARPQTLDETIELANDLMDQKLRTYVERQNENKRKTDNNQQQQPHKKQNVSRVCTADPGEKKFYTGDLPLCTKCNYHHTRQCAPRCGKCKRYGHTTTDCRANTNDW